MPQTELKIVYENNVTVTHGTMVTKNETLFRPEVSFEKPNRDSQYALIAVRVSFSYYAFLVNLSILLFHLYRLILMQSLLIFVTGLLVTLKVCTWIPQKL